MPSGITVEGLFGALVDQAGEEKARAWWEWFTVTYPGWARDGWARIDDARRSFVPTRPSGPP